MQIMEGFSDMNKNKMRQMEELQGLSLQGLHNEWCRVKNSSDYCRYQTDTILAMIENRMEKTK